MKPLSFISSHSIEESVNDNQAFGRDVTKFTVRKNYGTKQDRIRRLQLVCAIIVAMKVYSAFSVCCWITCHCERCKILSVAQQCFYGEFISPGNNKTAITTPPVRIHNDTSHWDKFLLDRTGWIDVCTHALHITNTDIGLRSANCQNYSYNKSQQYVDCLLADSQHN